MTSQHRIVLAYRRAKCGAHPERVLAALDDHYGEHEVIDLALEEDGEALDVISRRLRSDDVLLLLADAEWDVAWPGDDGDDELSGEVVFGSIGTLRIAVEAEAGGATLTMTERTWEADIERLLDQLDLRVGEASASTYHVGDGEDVDRLFDDAARLQESGRHQDAIGLFQTIVQSRTPRLAGRAAYAIARSYEQLQNPNFAVQAYGEAIALGPQDAAAAAAYGLGRLLRRRGEFGEAAAAFTQAIELGDAPMRARAEQLRDDALRKADRP